jgi:hypothetical protein
MLEICFIFFIFTLPVKIFYWIFLVIISGLLLLLIFFIPLQSIVKGG